MKDFSKELKQVPNKPGIYLMFDDRNTLIYVGKAVNLKRRVSSYFIASSQAKSVKVRSMVEHVDHFEYILAANEVEALVLESNFIKEHAPKYNIVLRDDKQYPYIAITKETYPRILKVRQVKNDGKEYFGPYPNAYAVNDMITFLQRNYRIRTCRLDIDGGKRLSRPCINYFIDQCPAPCVDKADPEAYQARIQKIKDILRGEDQEIRSYLTEEMEKSSKALNFERAARFRDDLENLDGLMARQKVSFTNGQDADLVAMARGGDTITIQVFFVRAGKLVDRQHFRMEDHFTESAPAVMSQFIKQFYLNAIYIPKSVYTEVEPEDHQTIEDFLTGRKGQRVFLKTPQRGDKNALMERAHMNAEEQLAKQEIRENRKNRSRDRGIKDLEEFLGLEDLDRIEAYDVSNISGVQNVGSMVVYKREKKQPHEYRKFKIRSVDGVDEYGSQREMLSRRFDHGLKDIKAGRTQTGFGVLPDLILMDGGKGQVNVCQEVLDQRDLDIPVLGMVKDDKHRTKGLLYKNREYLINPSLPLYKFLYAIQEEVHRFAISYHRQLRGKAMVQSELDDISGIGPKRRQALLREFGSVEGVRQAGLGELAQVDGMNRGVASNVFNYFHGQDAYNKEGGSGLSAAE